VGKRAASVGRRMALRGCALPPINHKGKDMVRPRGLVVLTMATLIAFACGSTSGGGGAKGTIKIGSDLPTCTAGGKSTQNGIDFAIKQKNAAGGVSGFTIQFVPFDDCRQAAYSADAGVENVTSMLGDSKFLGMIGPYNSAVAKAEIPRAAAQSFTMVSPSNTNPCLTKDLSTCSYHPQDLRGGKPNNYFRVVTTDDYQGPAMADYAYKTLNLKNVGVLDDSTVFGAGIADTFSSEFKKLGGTVTRDSYKKEQTSDWRSKLLTFKAAGAQAVYVGGTDDQNICIPRKQVRKEMAATKGFVGVIGTYDFDQNGDNSLKIVSIYTVQAVSDPTQSTGVCGKTASKDCFVWKTQFDFAKSSG